MNPVSLMWLENRKFQNRSFPSEQQAVQFLKERGIEGFAQVTCPRGSVIANLANVQGQVFVHRVQ